MVTQQKLKTHTFTMSECATHTVALERYPGEFCQRFCHVEVAQRANLEEGHLVLDGVGLGTALCHLPLVGQVQAVTNKDFGDTGSMLSKRNIENHLKVLRRRM